MKTNITRKKTLYTDFFPRLSIEANAQEIDRIGYLGMKSTHTKQYGYCSMIRKLGNVPTKSLKSFYRKRANKLSSKQGEGYDI